MTADNNASASLLRPRDACALVLFGATGDLSHRKLLPALYRLHTQGLLPERCALVAFARRDKTDADFRNDVRDALREFAKDLPTEGQAWDSFAESVFYVQSQLDDREGYLRLKKRLD